MRARSWGRAPRRAHARGLANVGGPLKKQVGSIRGGQPGRHPDQCMTGVGNDRKAEG